MLTACAYDFGETDVILSLTLTLFLARRGFRLMKAVVHHFGTDTDDEYQFKMPMGNLFTQNWQFVCKFRLHCVDRPKIEIV